ncbi:YjbF family lipoprotein [Sphingoaurantiacus capsulatus]|uniref:YjbF family lipoprotein n=1 Tax=Sphingoaurantiacus capsulatus TaxID=1771310 RepID=A0ABV7X8I2_9SPHN
MAFRVTYAVSSRRGALAMLSTFALTGCASSPFWGTIRAGIAGGTDDGPAISRAYADKLPYASMLAWFDGSPPALVVLAEFAANNRWVWHSAQRQSIATFGPFITGLLGVERELRSAMLAGGWDRNPLQLVGRRLERVIDVAAEGDRVQVALSSRFEKADLEEVEILGVRRTLRRVDEHVRSQGRHRFTNRYWVDEASGRCWKSSQTAVPTLPRFNIEILKYPSA